MEKDIMKKLLYILSLFALTACTENDDTTQNVFSDAVKMQGIDLRMTRSVSNEVAELMDYVGRKEFSDKDVAVFTRIRRTLQPIAQFNYKNLEFICSVKTTADVTSVGWQRDPTKGTTEGAGTESAPDRIYWSDATNPHTFIGYCTPQQGQGEKAFDWNMRSGGEGLEVYYGSLGDPTDGGTLIDYRSNFDSETKAETISGNVKICKDDILLTYSDNITAEDAIARLRFHHGLAQVRVIVNISDFAAGGDNTSADKKTVISNMKLKEMLTMYKWNQTDTTTVQLTDNDNSNLSSIYSTSVPAYNQRKDVMLWIPEPAGVGEGANKTFTFYGLAVPTEITSTKPLVFSFNASYPNPMSPSEMQTKTYAANIDGIKFESGKCTTINISLNHQNEKITVGASYEDWEFYQNPYQGALKKNSTFLASTDRGTGAVVNGVVNGITILGDAGATADDATWLYYNGTKVVDIYGNDGSKENPFTISTAKQLLSFAYEVKGTGRKSVTNNDGHDAGWNFQGKYVKLDADIHLQSVTNVDSITVNKQYVNKTGVQLLNWIGIGDASNAFNGNFIGGGRNITHLYGGAFFKNIGGFATVSELNLSDVVRVTDHGALAEQNGGFMYACRVEGEVNNSTSDFVGSLCGDNTGFIFACIHNGAVKGTKAGAKVGGLLGRNHGTLAVSYHTGAIEGTYRYGVEERAYVGSNIFACYYNKTLAKPTDTVDPEHVTGKTLGEMQSRSFANELNNAIKTIVDDSGHKGLLGSEMQEAQITYFLSILENYEFVFTPGAYPRVEKTSKNE